SDWCPPDLEAPVEEHGVDHLALESTRDLAALDTPGEYQELVHGLGTPVFHRQEIPPPPAHCSASSSAPSTRLHSDVAKLSGGIRRSTLGSLAVPVSTRRWNSACCTGIAGRSRCSPSSNPRPVTFEMPSVIAPWRSRSPWTRALAIKPSRAITSSVASAAAQTTGPPPNV